MPKWWWLSTPYATGGVQTVEGVIVGGAPVFKSLTGQVLAEVARKGNYKVEPLGCSGAHA